MKNFLPLRSAYHSCSDRIAEISNKEKVDAAALAVLRTNLEKLMRDNIRGKFINSVIKNIPENKIDKGIVSATKFKGTILDAFDSVNKTGGFWISDTTLNRGDYIPTTNHIQFGRNSFRPNSNIPTSRVLTAFKSYPSFRKDPRGIPFSEKLETMLVLVHELIHSFYQGNPTSKVNFSHKQMDKAAQAALSELGITPIMKSFGEMAEFFEAAFIQVCSGIEL